MNRTTVCFKACSSSSKIFKISSINLNLSLKSHKTWRIRVTKDLKALVCVLLIQVWCKWYPNHHILPEGKLVGNSRRADLNPNHLIKKVEEAVLVKSSKTTGWVWEIIHKDLSQTQVVICKPIYRYKLIHSRHRQQHNINRKNQKIIWEIRVRKSIGVSLVRSQSPAWVVATVVVNKTKKTLSIGKISLFISLMETLKNSWFLNSTNSNLTMNITSQYMPQGLTSSSKILVMHTAMFICLKQCQIKSTNPQIHLVSIVTRITSKCKLRTKIFYTFKHKRPKNTEINAKNSKSKYQNSKTNWQRKKSWLLNRRVSIKRSNRWRTSGVLVRP